MLHELVKSRVLSGSFNKTGSWVLGLRPLLSIDGHVMSAHSLSLVRDTSFIKRLVRLDIEHDLYGMLSRDSSNARLSQVIKGTLPLNVYLQGRVFEESRASLFELSLLLDLFFGDEVIGEQLAAKLLKVAEWSDSPRILSNVWYNLVKEITEHAQVKPTLSARAAKPTAEKVSSSSSRSRSRTHTKRIDQIAAGIRGLALHDSAGIGIDCEIENDIADRESDDERDQDIVDLEENRLRMFSYRVALIVIVRSTSLHELERHNTSGGRMDVAGKKIHEVIAKTLQEIIKIPLDDLVVKQERFRNVCEKIIEDLESPSQVSEFLRTLLTPIQA